MTDKTRKSKPGFTYWCCGGPFPDHKPDCPNSISPPTETRKRESGKHLKEIATPVERHDADDPDTDTGPSSVVEALPTEPDGESWELARRFHETYEALAPKFGYKTRKESAKPWADVPHTNRQLMAATCAVILTRLRAEKAELSRQLEEARLRITNLETGRSRKRNQIKVLRGKLASLKHRNWLDGIPRVTHSDAKWKLLNTGLKLRAEAAEAKLAEATEELEDYRSTEAHQQELVAKYMADAEKAKAELGEMGKK